MQNIRTSIRKSESISDQLPKPLACRESVCWADVDLQGEAVIASLAKLLEVYCTITSQTPAELTG